MGGLCILWDGFAFFAKGLYLVQKVSILCKRLVFCAMGLYFVGGVCILCKGFIFRARGSYFWEGFIFCDVCHIFKRIQLFEGHIKALNSTRGRGLHTPEGFIKHGCCSCRTLVRHSCQGRDGKTSARSWMTRCLNSVLINCATLPKTYFYVCKIISNEPNILLGCQYFTELSYILDGEQNISILIINPKIKMKCHFKNQIFIVLYF